MKSLLSSVYAKLALIIFFLSLAYFVLRVPNLTRIPVFVDEAIYVRWSQVMKSEPTLRFLPQSDGKQPLFMWINMPFFKVFKDPLVAGRMVSVGAGTLALTGIVLLTFIITSSLQVAALSGVIYLLTPFTYFFDRMALVDSLLSALGIWVVMLNILFIRTKRADISMILGFFLGFSLLTKSPAVFFVLLLPLSLLFLNSRPKYQDILKIAAGWLVAIVIGYGMYNILRLGPNFHLIGSRNADYLFSFSEVLTHPTNPLIGNLKSSFSWTLNLVSPVIFILVFAAFIKPSKEKIALLALFLIPIFAQASIAKVYTSRYFLYTIPPLLILASIGFFEIYKKYLWLAFSLFAIFVIYSSVYIKNLQTDPAKAYLPQNMAHGYLQEWTAGWGQKEIAQYLIERSKQTKVLVGTEGYFGTLPDGLQIYTERVPNLTVIGIGLPIKGVPDNLKNGLIDSEVYIVSNQSREDFSTAEKTRIELVFSFDKPVRPDGTREVLHLYRVKF